MDVMRIIRASSVCGTGGAAVIGYDECVAFEISDVFLLRAKLHRQLYQHRAVKVVEKMLIELMYAIDQTRGPGTKLREMAMAAESMAELTDSAVLDMCNGDDGVRRSRDRLFQRPWYRPVDCFVRIHSSPCCAHCKKETRIADAFCGNCGKSTEDRPGVRAPDGVMAPPGASLTEREATEYVTGKLKEEGVEVFTLIHIIDIQVGKTLTVTDPHGHTWIDHDPLNKVTFFSRERYWIGLPESACHMPRVRHVRVAHCYVPVSVSQADYDAVSQAFREWGASVGELGMGSDPTVETIP
jgi:hypothetical protein